MRTKNRPTAVRITKPLPAPQQVTWEQEVYEADPTGGQPSRY